MKTKNKPMSKRDSKRRKDLDILFKKIQAAGLYDCNYTGRKPVLTGVYRSAVSPNL